MGDDLSNGDGGVLVECELVSRYRPERKLAHDAVCLSIRHVGDPVERHGSWNLHDPEGTNGTAYGTPSCGRQQGRGQKSSSGRSRVCRSPNRMEV
jgi:hypothetical protein